MFGKILYVIIISLLTSFVLIKIFEHSGDRDYDDPEESRSNLIMFILLFVIFMISGFIKIALNVSPSM